MQSTIQTFALQSYIMWGPMIVLADCEGPDQTVQMGRLIWAFAVRICPKGQTLPWWSEEATKTPSKPPSRISTYQQSHGNKLHRTEQSGEASSEEVLVNMRQKESEQKHAQRKARAKAPPTELSCSDLCSICNRQFRARIGLIIHLRTHKQ